MDSHELNLAGKLLGMAGETYSNHGCNDMEEEFWDGWTIEQKRKLAKDICYWNGDSEEYNQDDVTFTDWLVMSYFADKLISEANSAK